MSQMKTPTSNSMVVLGGENAEAFTSCRPTSSGKKRVIRREGSTTSLEILPPEDEDKNSSRSGKKKSSRSSPDNGNSSRPSSRTSRPPPIRPDSGSGRRSSTPSTPTRQVTLQAVKRKQERDEDLSPLDLESSDLTEKTASADSEEFDTDLEDQLGSNEEAEEEEKSTAPNELMLEFLDCLYNKEWDVAKKLCRMILIYEPENADANKFSTLIEEKLQIVAERGSDEETGDEDESGSEESDSDDDSSGSDDDNASFQGSSDADSEPEDDDSDIVILPAKKNSSSGKNL